MLALIAIFAIPALILLSGVVRMLVASSDGVWEETTTHYYSPQGEGWSNGRWFLREFGRGNTSTLHIGIGTYSEIGCNGNGYCYETKQRVIIPTITWTVDVIELMELKSKK